MSEQLPLFQLCVLEPGSVPFHAFNVIGEPKETAGRIHKLCNGNGWLPLDAAREGKAASIEDGIHAKER